MTIEYLNNKVFEEIINRFSKAQKTAKKNTKEFKESEQELSAAFYILASNIIRAFKFQLVDKDDALQEGVLICFAKLHRFRPELGRAFNFCTTIILNHYRQLYRTAKNYNELKLKYHDFLWEKSDDIYLLSSRTKRPKNKYKK